ncbi:MULTISPECIES: hypothetical protein [Neobacillus]|uniref:Uncharacterized protein n=1 Tax=Neobacillus rhizophilus TaxID=2833579 RepID=A0A942U0F8_9BACI|nr:MULTISPECIES: hypothetical protein [Neobacillus]MBS4210995.1 hypothetical protein [Neobacillus rhizophilus]
MEKEHNQISENPSKETDNEAIMNRVNQTFDKISQDVKEMINENNNQLS